MICPRCNLSECTPRCGWCDYLPTAAEREATCCCGGGLTGPEVTHSRDKCIGFDTAAERETVPAPEEKPHYPGCLCQDCLEWLSRGTFQPNRTLQRGGQLVPVASTGSVAGSTLRFRVQPREPVAPETPEQSAAIDDALDAAREEGRRQERERILAELRRRLPLVQDYQALPGGLRHWAQGQEHELLNLIAIVGNE